MPAYRLQNGIKLVRVNISGRPGEGKIYRFFLKRGDEILEDGKSFSETELRAYLRKADRGKEDERTGD